MTRSASSLFSPGFSGRPVLLKACFLLACLAVFLLHSPAHALPPKQFVFTTPAARLVADTVRVDLSITVDNEEGLRDMLKDGAVLELAIDLTLERKRSLWANAEVAARRYVSVLRHDPLTREFLLTLPGNGNGQFSETEPDGETPPAEEVPGNGKTREIRDKNLTRLLNAGWRALSLPLAPMQDIQAENGDADYEILINISLEHIEVPPWLEKSVLWSSSVVPSASINLPFSPAAHSGP